MDTKITYLVLIVISVFVLGCSPQPPIRSVNAATLPKLLRDVDPLPNVWTNYSEANWKQLIFAAKLFQKSDPASIENALRTYQSTHLEFEQELQRDEKLYLLMRVVFDLPENASTNIFRERWSFAPYVTMGTDRNKDGSVNVAWPLTWNNGHPRLISGFQGLQSLVATDPLNGDPAKCKDPYDVFAEYKYYLGKYRFRDLSSFPN